MEYFFASVESNYRKCTTFAPPLAKINPLGVSYNLFEKKEYIEFRIVI